jgi:hypothetical protein
VHAIGKKAAAKMPGSIAKGLQATVFKGLPGAEGYLREAT